MDDVVVLDEVVKVGRLWYGVSMEAVCDMGGGIGEKRKLCIPDLHRIYMYMGGLIHGAANAIKETEGLAVTIPVLACEVDRLCYFSLPPS